MAAVKTLIYGGLLGFLLLPVSARPVPLETAQRVMNRDNWDEYTAEQVRFSPDGTQVAVATDNGRLWLFDRVGARLRKRWQVPLGEGVRLRGLAFSKDGTTLYTAEQSLLAQVQAVAVTNGQVRWRYSAQADLKGEIGPGTFAGINRNLALDRQGNIYALAYWTVFGGPKAGARIEVLSLNPQGQMRWRYGLDQTVSGGIQVSTTAVALTSSAFDLDYTASKGLTTTLLDPSTGKVILTAPFPAGKGAVCPPEFSPDGKNLWVLGGNGALISYQVQPQRLIPRWQKQLSVPVGQVTTYYKSLIASRPGQWLVLAGPTASLPGATNESPPREHPDSNRVLLLDDRGQLRNHWAFPSLDRPPTWNPPLLLLPIAQNTVTPRPRGLMLLNLPLGKTRTLVTTAGAVLSADSKDGYYAALEVPLLSQGQVIGTHQLHFGPLP